ncbi:MAG: hypothetical protein COY40_00260 [Alphaproteobacteria bacterium CG_4_10_14_0_8_um_filter_53_9]|nr:MAG: hypothetical protein COY40_00260 [Alphaproteobacteria bacterium CG_4_10_14_0_8_um_filter_53_9]
MQQVHFDTPFETRLQKLDLTRIMARVEAETGLDKATLARAEELYRQFLTLHNRYKGQSFVPPQIVDYVWHSHIEHTRQYMADCDMLFGAYLHHEPTDEDTTADYEAKTIPAYAQEFGEDILMARQHNAKLFSGTGCG